MGGYLIWSVAALCLCSGGLSVSVVCACVHSDICLRRSGVRYVAGCGRFGPSGSLLTVACRGVGREKLPLRGGTVTLWWGRGSRPLFRAE